MNTVTIRRPAVVNWSSAGAIVCVRNSRVCSEWKDIEAEMPEALQAAEYLTQMTELMIFDQEAIDTEASALIIS